MLMLIIFFPYLYYNVNLFCALEISGYLTSDANPSKHVGDILIELINTCIDQKLITASTLCNSENHSPELMAITSICTVLDQMLGACHIPAENVLAVLSALFLRLGMFISVLV